MLASPSVADQFSLFVKNVGRHWGLLLGGTVVGGLDIFREGLGLGDWPRYLFLTLASTAVFWAFFAAWRDEHLARLKAQSDLAGVLDLRPSAVCRVFLQQERYLCLEVRNEGCQGLFRALAEIEEAGNPANRVTCLWQGATRARELQIERNLNGLIQVGFLEEDHRVDFDEDGEQQPVRVGWRVQGAPAWLYGRRNLGNEDGDWFTLRITLISEPQMTANIVKRLRFRGREVIDLDSGDRLRPGALIQRDDDDYPE